MPKFAVKTLYRLRTRSSASLRTKSPSRAPKPRSPKLLVTSPSLLAAERMALEAELRQCELAERWERFMEKAQVEHTLPAGFPVFIKHISPRASEEFFEGPV